MHHELKALITNLPDMIVTEFNARAVPYVADFTFPVPVTALFNLIRSECLITAGVRSSMAAEMDQVLKHLGPKHKCYKKCAEAPHETVNQLVYAMRHVLEGISPQLYVSLSSFLMKATNECDLLKLLGTHYANDMDQDLPYYVQLAKDWHREWCNSSVPEGMIDEKYPHDQVPVLVFMRSIVGVASERKAETALPWAKEVEDVVRSKLEWLSPTEVQLLRIITSRLDSRDVDNDFLKYFL